MPIICPLEENISSSRWTGSVLLVSQRRGPREWVLSLKPSLRRRPPTTRQKCRLKNQAACSASRACLKVDCLATALLHFLRRMKHPPRDDHCKKAGRRRPIPPRKQLAASWCRILRPASEKCPEWAACWGILKCPSASWPKATGTGSGRRRPSEWTAEDY